MTALFIDTSALAKRYVIETGTKWMRSQTRPSAGNNVIIAGSTPIELFSLLARRQREGSIKANAAGRLRRIVLRHVKDEYLTIPLDEALLARARGLVIKHPLRALDALQLACALEASLILNVTMTFIGADNNLLAIAAVEGFSTDNPYAHP